MTVQSVQEYYEDISSFCSVSSALPYDLILIVIDNEVAVTLKGDVAARSLIIGARRPYGIPKLVEDEVAIILDDKLV